MNPSFFWIRREFSSELWFAQSPSKSPWPKFFPLWKHRQAFICHRVTRCFRGRHWGPRKSCFSFFSSFRTLVTWSNSPGQPQDPRAGIPQNCCGDCRGNCRGNSGCWGECWGNCCRDVRFSAPQSKVSPAGSLRSSSPALAPAPRVSPAVSPAVSTAVLENSNSGVLWLAGGVASFMQQNAPREGNPVKHRSSFVSISVQMVLAENLRSQRVRGGEPEGVRKQLLSSEQGLVCFKRLLEENKASKKPPEAF